MSDLQKHITAFRSSHASNTSWHARFASALAAQTTGQEQRQPTPENGTMLQAFEWYISNDGKHLQRLTKDLGLLKEMGISAMWIPPQCKGDAGVNDTGYGVYDLWDLGEFDQKGTVRTKYGDVHDLKTLAEQAEKTGVKLYFDAVLNHKAGGDERERCRAQKVDIHDRQRSIGGEQEINAWFHFNFPGRKGKLSNMIWHWYHFTGTDWDDYTKENGCIYRVLGDGKSWATDVDGEDGNYDYLMFADIDHKHPEVRKDIMDWSLWVSNKLKLGGMRFDAVKHYSEGFLLDLLNNLTSKHAEDWFSVGEFWKDDVGTMHHYLDIMHHQFSLFDTPLVYKFSQASYTPNFDLRGILDGTLVQSKPINAVTLVQNHDTQPGQALEVGVNGWFKPLAHALILLRISGYPCIFWGDLYGTQGPQGREQEPSCGGALPDMILARKLYAYGEQNDYFDYATCIGWVRRGTWDRPDGCAVVMSDAGAGYKRMYVGLEHKGETWTDVLGWNNCKAVVGADGFAQFECSSTSVSIYVRDGAPGREQFGKIRPHK